MPADPPTGPGPATGPERPTEPRTLQLRLRALADRARAERGAPGAPLPLSELAADIEHRTGVAVPRPTLWKLLAGRITNPHVETLVPIAEYFGVSVDHLLGRERPDDGARARALLDDTLRERGVEHIALRASGLSPDTLGLITRLIDQARVAEGLDPRTTRTYRPHPPDAAAPGGAAAGRAASDEVPGR